MRCGSSGATYGNVIYPCRDASTASRRSGGGGCCCGRCSGRRCRCSRRRGTGDRPRVPSDGLNPRRGRIRILRTSNPTLVLGTRNVIQHDAPATPSHQHLTRRCASVCGSLERRKRWDLPHPSAAASATHVASVEGSMYPLLASEVVPGLPITSLSRETPLAEIWKSAVSGQVDEEAVKRPAHVVYSVAPSVDRMNSACQVQDHLARSLTIVELCYLIDQSMIVPEMNDRTYLDIVLNNRSVKTHCISNCVYSPSRSSIPHCCRPRGSHHRST